MDFLKVFLGEFTNIAMVTIVVDYLIKIDLSCFDQSSSVKYIIYI